MNKAIRMLLTVICLICVCACTSNPSINTTKNSDVQSSHIQAENSEKIYHIGEQITIDNDNEKYHLTFTAIKETDERNQFTDKQANRVVIISYDYENVSQSSDLHISDFNFKLYDKESVALETYPADIKYPQAVSAGRKTSGEVAYALNSNENYIELEYYDNMFSSKSDCKVILEW